MGQCIVLTGIGSSLSRYLINRAVWTIGLPRKYVKKGGNSKSREKIVLLKGVEKYFRIFKINIFLFIFSDSYKYQCDLEEKVATTKNTRNILMLKTKLKNQQVTVGFIP